MQPLRILVVAAESNDRDLLAEGLAAEGFAVTQSSSSLEALTSLSADKVDLVLLDDDTPGIRPLDVCRTIKSKPELCDLLVFIRSNQTNRDIRTAALAAGADDFVTKEPEPSALIQHIWRTVKLIQMGCHPGFRAEQPFGDIEAPVIRSRQDRYGDYRIGTVVGSDVVGNVYRATDVLTNRPVALQVLSPKVSEDLDFVRRYIEVVHGLSSLNHAGIPTILHFAEQDGEYYLAREWVSKGSLAMFVRNAGRLEPGKTLKITLQAARALQAAAQAGVIHGRLKPNYILLDDDENAKVSEIGLLLFGATLSDEVLRLRMLLEVAPFLTPEHDNPASLDFRSDIYSLGMILYYALCGALPLSSSLNPVEARLQLPAFEDLGGAIPRELYVIIEKMTQLDPERRYTDYGSLIQDLEEQLRAVAPTPSLLQTPVVAEVSEQPDLAGADLFDVLAQLYRDVMSGVLTLQWRGLRKKYLVREGEIVLFESTQPEEDFWTVLARVEPVRAYVERPKDEPLDISLNRLVRMGVLTAERIAGIYNGLLMDSILQVFRWPERAAEFRSAKIVNEAFAGLRIPDILAEAIRNITPMETVRSHVPAGAFIVRTPRFVELISGFHLTAEESFLVFRVEGEGLTSRALGLLCVQPEETILRFLYLLERIGAVELRSGEEPRQPSWPKVQSSGTERNLAAEKQIASEEEKARAKRLEEAVVRVGFFKSEKGQQDVERRNKGEQLFQRAFRAFVSNDYGQTMLLCKEALQYHKEARCYELLARACAKHPRFGKEAEEAFHEAIELSPYEAGLHVTLAHFYLERGLLIRSRTHCDEALKLDHKDPHAVKLGELLKKKQVGAGDCWCKAPKKK